MNMKKTVGTIIIGIAITLAVSLLPLLIWRDQPATGNTLGRPYYIQLEGTSLFKYLLFIGLSIVTMIGLRNSKKIMKAILYPALTGIIIGILLGIVIPVRQHGGSFGSEVYEFNNVLFYVFLGIGSFVTLIVLGTRLTRSK